jgi:hypothetical protein
MSRFNLERVRRATERAYRATSAVESSRQQEDARFAHSELTEGVSIPVALIEYVVQIGTHGSRLLGAVTGTKVQARPSGDALGVGPVDETGGAATCPPALSRHGCGAVSSDPLPGKVLPMPLSHSASELNATHFR